MHSAAVLLPAALALLLGCSSPRSGAEVLNRFTAKALVPFVGIKPFLFGWGSLWLQRQTKSSFFLYCRRCLVSIPSHPCFAAQ